jgi:hypothetical protein
LITGNHDRRHLVKKPSRVIPSGHRRLHMHVVSDLSGAWNPPELRPQSRAKADLGTAPKHQGPNRHSRRVPAGGPSPCGPGGPAAAGPLLAVHRELGAKAEKGARPVKRRRRKGRLPRQGSALDAADVGRSFRLVASAAGLNPRNGLSASYGTVSCGCYQALGDHRGIAHLVGHGSMIVTKRVYRNELRPVITRERAPSTSS